MKIDQCVLLGSCIGPSFAFSLMKHSPERFPVAVLLQPIGLAKHTIEPVGWVGINSGMRGSFKQWSETLLEQKRFSLEEFNTLHEEMYGDNQDFVFSIRREDLSSIQQPMLVFQGKDCSHPAETAREIARLVPNATLIEKWRDEDYSVENVDHRIIEFLSQFK